MNTSPCYKDGIKCQNRCAEPNCHMTCAEYLAWEKAKREADAARREKIERENAVVAVQIEQRKRFAKYGREQSQRKNNERRGRNKC